jgi:excinuclease ABC subunit A
MSDQFIKVVGANEHNLNNLSIDIPRNKITVVTGVSGSGKSSLAFDTVLAESQRRAISLEQNETQPSRRSTVASITDVGELLGVVYARFGEKNCPTHKTPTSSVSLDEIVDNILSEFNGQLIAVTSPIVENKKGVFKAQLTKAFNQGCQRAFIDGQVVLLDPIPRLEREYKHTIKIITDYIKIAEAKRDRLKRAVRQSLEMNDGYAEIFVADKKGEIDLETLKGLSTSDGCAECGYSWPRLDSRHFSANSLGRCQDCYGYGLEPSEYNFEDEKQLEYVKSAADVPCQKCGGTGLNPKYDSIKVSGVTLRSLYESSIKDLVPKIRSLNSNKLSNNEAFSRVHEKILTQLSRLLDVGLDYLHLGRRVLSLSGGEGQRLKLAGILSEKLRGVLYVLDEPSQGLHPAELEIIWENLSSLRNAGNTVIIVDHDSVFIKKADLVIDLGPGGGKSGGNIQAVFDPKDIEKYVDTSKTAASICANDDEAVNEGDKSKNSFLTLKNVKLHNLDIASVSFMIEGLNVVTGVSGAGKTSLVMGVLVPNIEESAPEVADGYELEDDWYYSDKIDGYEHISAIRVVNRKPIAKSSVSMPATYLDCFKYLRDLFAKLPDAQIYGLTPKHFSFASDLGRCPECKGRGLVTLSMKFLADAKETCSLCNGKRYQDEVLAVKFKGYSLSEILSLTIEEVYELFSHHKQLEKRLRPALDLGLGYLQFGQPSSTLSGGEAQRLKLVPLLTKNWEKGSMLVLDEPTRGLHFKDVDLLMNCLRELVEKGTTVIVIEHHSTLIKRADWVVDLGPGSSDLGGKVVYQGLVKGFLNEKKSKTAMYLN